MWIISANFLLNEQGIYGDEKLAEQIREQRNKESGYNIRRLKMFKIEFYLINIYKMSFFLDINK